MLETLMPSLNELITSSYEKVKTKETENIIKALLLGLIPAKHPVLIQVSGIPGAGKSTFCAAHCPKNFLFISFDKIMTMLAGYQKDLIVLGAPAAFERYEMPARIIGYELLSRALSQKLNIMLEHSGTNPAHLELIKNVPLIGYQAAVYFIICDKSLAVKRAKEREKKQKRHIPESLIEERSQKVAEFLAAYQKVASEVKIFNGANNFHPLNKI